MGKSHIALVGGFVIFALVCIFGGQALAGQVRQEQEKELQAQLKAEAELIAAQEQERRDAEDKTPPSFEVPVRPSPRPAAPGTADGQTTAVVGANSPNHGVTITKDENGNQTITPNWSKEGGIPDNAIVVPGKADANMGGSGGGRMDLDEDGGYHGDHPGVNSTPTPTASGTETPTPIVTPAPGGDETPTPTPATTPSGNAEETTPGQPAETSKPDNEGKNEPETPTEPNPTPTPTPKPNTPSGGDSTPHNGQISEDGTKRWVDGFGWVDKQPPGISTPSKGTHTELSGNKVGSM